jgi:hypothetical protein
MMNENPEFASTWKGRILMHLESFGEDNIDEEKAALAKHPERKVQPLQEEDHIRELAIEQNFLGPNSL